MSEIKYWSETAATNGVASPDGAIEGWAPSEVNAVYREGMSATRKFYGNIEWREFADGTGTGDCHIVTYGSATTFTLASGDGDVTAIYHARRRIRAVGSSTGTVYGTIYSSSHSSVTTVTVVWDSTQLSNEALTISLGLSVTGSPTGINNVIHVRDFTTGDGATDDVTGINAAITACSAAGGGVVVFEAKQYAIKNSIVMKSGVSLQGVGPGGLMTSAYIDNAGFASEAKTRILAVATWTTGASMLKVQTTALANYAIAGCTISDIWFDGDSLPPYGIRLLSAQNCIFNNLIVSRCTSVNIEEDCLIPDVTGATARVGGSSTTIKLAATSSNRNDLYNGLSIEITAGTSSGDTRTISDYVGSSQIATVSAPWTATPDATSVYTITGTGVAVGQNATNHNAWRNIMSWCATPSSTIGWRQIGNPANDINRSTYDNLYIVHDDGHGMLIKNADSNTYTNLMTYANGTGRGIYCDGSDVNSTEFARALTFIQPQPSGFDPSGTGGFYAAAGTTKSPNRIFLLGHLTENLTPTPIIEAGCEVVVMKDDIGGNLTPGWELLHNFTAGADSHTGDTAETAFANGDVSLETDVMGANGAIRVRYGVSSANDASAKDVRVRWGASIVSSDVCSNNSIASAVYLQNETTIQNRNSTSSQLLYEGYGSSTTALRADPTRDSTAASLKILVTVTLADSADTVTLEWLTVELRRKP